MKIYSHRSRIFFTLGFLVGACVIGLLAVAAHADEPTTIKRVRGKAGMAERIESRGKSGKENVVRVSISRIVGDAVVQDRKVVTGSDVFASKPVPERKAAAKERPQPASVKPQAVQVVKVKVK